MIPEFAVQVARYYVETTRSMREFNRVVERVEDITFAPPRNPHEQQEIAQAVDRLQAAIRQPYAEATATGFAVVLYVLRGSVLERRMITISHEGNLIEHTEPVTSGLPTPISG